MVNKAFTFVLPIIDKIKMEPVVEEYFTHTSSFETLSELLPDGLIVTNTTGVVLFCNQSSAAMLGYEKNAMIGSHLERVLSMKDSLLPEERDFEFLKKKVGTGAEILVESNAGVTLNLYVRIKNLQHHTFLILLKDLSGQKGQEKILTNEIFKRAELEQRNFILNENMNLAQRIQKASLASIARFSEFTDHFVLYRPKDKVSGDLYTVLKKDNNLYVAIVDCNMNSISGGYMSLLVQIHLDYCISHGTNNRPTDILSELNRRIRHALGYSENEAANDLRGFHTSLCKIDIKDRVVFFAAAKRPLLVIGSGSYKEVFGDQHLLLTSHDDTEFTERRFHIQDDESIYLLSDGLANQENKNGEVYGRAKLIDFLLQRQTLKMAEQKEALEREFLDWMEDMEQTDDVTIVGIKL